MQVRYQAAPRPDFRGAMLNRCPASCNHTAVPTARKRCFPERQRERYVIYQLLERHYFRSFLIMNVDLEPLLNRENQRHEVQRVSPEVTGESRIGMNHRLVNTQRRCDQRLDLRFNL